MKHFKLFFALFAMLALGVGNTWGADVTYVFEEAADNPGNANDWLTADIDSYTSWSATKGGSNNPKYYNTGTGLRVYNGGKFTITSSKTLASITLTFSGTGYTFQSNNTTNPQTVTPNAKSYEWSVGRTCRLQKIEITYAADAGGETPEPDPDPTPDPEPEPGPGGEETWTLVTNASDLKTGDQIVIAAKDYNYAISTTQNNNNRGQAAVTKSGDNITFGADVQILTLEAGTQSNTFALNTGSGYLYASSSSGNQLKTQATNNDNGSWSISISSETATIKANGTNSRNVMQYNQSSSLFACYSSASQKALSIYKKVTSSGGGDPGTPTPSVSVAPTSHTFATTNVGETATQEFTITTENTTATLTASIDNTTDYAVSAIAGNKVTVTYQPQSAGTHPAVLTVKAGEEATATVNLTGEAIKALEGTWILVTDASSLKAGDEIIIAAKESDVALSTTQASNNRPEVAITKNDNTITATSETQVLTLQAGTKEGTLALSTGDGYLFAASSSSNWLRTETTLSDNSSWKVTIAADGTATLIAQGTNTRNTLYYNKSSKIFSCYSTAQQSIVLYKNTNGQQLAGLAYATTKYLTKLGDAFTTPTLTNPNSLTVTYSSSDNNVATVADGAVTIKAAGVVTITASFTGNSSFLEGSASYTIGVTEHAGTQADPYSVADARRVIDVMETAEGVYATGVVSEIVTAYNSQYGNISYNISVDGTTGADQLLSYHGKSYNGDSFASADDVKVGDEVVVKGNLKKYNTTYEFDENNQLVSLNRTKQQAGLAYEDTELTTNVGEEFTEPALTNPYSLSITYSSSNTSLATVDANGDVTILAAGKVTITASTTGNASYAAGSASYNITITNPGLAVATLPFAFNGNKAAIETTAGMTQNGLGSDYSASTAPNSQLKFDGTGDWVVIRFDSEPEKLSYDIKNNSFSGGTFSVQESADGETYTDVAVHTEITETQSEEHTLLSTSRYVKFIYAEKVNGNVGLGNIKITKPDNRADAGLAWNPTSVTLTQGEAFTAPTLNKPNSVSGITYETSNDEVATVTAEGVIALATGIGTATITATFAGDATYKPATATCTITVNEYIETLDGEWQLVTDASKLQAGMEIIIASVADAGTVKTMGEQGNNNRSAVASTVDGDKLNPAVGTTVITLEDCQLYEGLFALKTKDGYLYAASSSSNHLKSQEGINKNACWTITITEGVAAVAATYSSNRKIMRYNETSDLFSCYASGQKDIALYAKKPAHTRTTSAGRYGTICLPGNIVKCLGATLYEVAGKDGMRVVFDEVLNPEAGMPYIFLAHNAEVLFYCGDETAATPGYHKSLYGTFSVLQDAQLDGMYMVQNNKIVKCAATGCGVAENRAYFNGAELEALGSAPAPMPGRRRITMSTESENTATGTEDVVAPAGQTLKLIENGQLIIIRNGEKFNAQGQKL